MARKDHVALADDENRPRSRVVQDRFAEMAGSSLDRAVVSYWRGRFSHVWADDRVVLIVPDRVLEET